MSDTPTPERPWRFSWPLRLVIGFVLFEMTFQSLTVLVPWEKWAEELGVDDLPKTMPPRQEFSAKAGESMRSLSEYLVPWPSAEVQPRLTTWEARGKFAFVWLATRLDFYENLVGLDEHWTMFSPGVSNAKTISRARLIFADGSEQLVRPAMDPVDLTHFEHWFEGKVIAHEMKVRDERYRPCLGWCNLLAHRYGHNEAGSPLWRIVLYEVRYNYPPPGADAQAFLHDQMRKTRHLSTAEYRDNFRAKVREGMEHLRLDADALPTQVSPDYFEYDLATGKGHFLD
jgi:hypothetical protein